jgi:hypothetical protein
MSCGGDNFIVPGANPCNNGGGGTAGVTTLNSFAGNVSITALDSSIGVSNQGGNIVLSATGLQAVDSLNGESGALNIINGANTSVITNGSDISINVPTIVNSLNTVTGGLTLVGTGGTTVTNVGTAFSVNTPLPSIVNTLNTRSGALTVTGGGDTVVTNVLNAFTVTTNIPVKNIFQGDGITVTNVGSGVFTIALTPKSPGAMDTLYIPAPVALLPSVENIVFTSFVTPVKTVTGYWSFNAMFTVKSLVAVPTFQYVSSYYKRDGTRIQPSDTYTSISGLNQFFTIPMSGSISVNVGSSATITLNVVITGGVGTALLNSGQIVFTFVPSS